MKERQLGGGGGGIYQAKKSEVVYKGFKKIISIFNISLAF
jgi:hypothetical protein